jgi:hypothetical protein
MVTTTTPLRGQGRRRPLRSASFARNRRAKVICEICDAIVYFAHVDSQGRRITIAPLGAHATCRRPHRCPTDGKDIHACVVASTSLGLPTTDNRQLITRPAQEPGTFRM